MANVMEQLLADATVREDQNLVVVAADNGDEFYPWEN
jgi:hypothetical protein